MLRTFQASLTVILLFLFGCSAQSRLVNSDWYEVRTEHFSAVTNGSPARVKDLVGELERFRLFAETRLNIGTLDQPLKIYALADHPSYGALVGRQRSNRTVATLRNTSHGAVVIVDLSANSWLPGDEVCESLLHEYTHFLSRFSSLTHYPYWLSEGIAEFYSTIQFNPDGSTELGRVPFLLAYTLKNQAPLPLAEVLTKTESDIAGKEQTLGLRLHAGAWMLTHWLMLNAEQDSLSRYLQAHTDGAGPEKAIQQALNLPFEELQSIYRRLPREGFAYVRYPAQEAEHLQEPVVNAIPKSQALGQLGHLMAISDASDETLLALIDYARAEGTDIPALVAIQAVAKAKNGYAEEAELLLRGLAPVDQTELWYKDAEAAVAMAEILSSEKGYENFADLKQLRNKYLALVNSHSTVPAYWHGLAICLQMLGYPREDYLPMLEQAFLRAPWQTEIAWWYAHELYLERDREMFKWVAYGLMMQMDEKRSRDELIAMSADLGETVPGKASKVDNPSTELLAHAIRSYRGSAAYKAVAMALDYRGRVAFGISSQSRSQRQANDRALRACNKQLKNRTVRAKCQLYAEGKRVVANSAKEPIL